MRSFGAHAAVVVVAVDGDDDDDVPRTTNVAKPFSSELKNEIRTFYSRKGFFATGQSPRILGGVGGQQASLRVKRAQLCPVCALWVRLSASTRRGRDVSKQSRNCGEG